MYQALIYENHKWKKWRSCLCPFHGTRREAKIPGALWKQSLLWVWSSWALGTVHVWWMESVTPLTTPVLPLKGPTSGARMVWAAALSSVLIQFNRCQRGTCSCQDVLELQIWRWQRQGLCSWEAPTLTCHSLWNAWTGADKLKFTFTEGKAKHQL